MQFKEAYIQYKNLLDKLKIALTFLSEAQINYRWDDVRNTQNTVNDLKKEIEQFEYKEVK